jgi:Tol biopolymer transport system component
VDKETELGLLASAILEGKAVDWESAGSTARESDRVIVRQLQIVAEIAALHRSLPDLEERPAAERQPATDETGAAIAWGHLRLFEMVGRGTFGEVYRAWDTHLDREVALKLLRAGEASGDPSLSLGDPTRVVHEGRLLARVRHPHVITVFGAEGREGRVGIWMEFIRGRTLHQIVAEQGALGPREAAAVGSDLCQALAAVHAAGLLHRDVTARNVMREEGGRVVLMDFGAGHEQTGDAGARNDTTGTPLYMAPELYAGARADQRTDIYALGVLLYYLASGRYPVSGGSFAGIRDAHQRGERVRLRDVRADLPVAFVQAVEKATAADPALRCQTVGELESMLGTSLVGGRETAPAGTHVRRPVVAAIAAAAIVTIGTVAAIYKPWRTAFGQGSAGTPPAAAAADVTARKISLPETMMLFSNPSDDGRFVAGTMIDGGDVGIADLTTAKAKPLGMGKGDYSDGYASITALSPDGSTVAVNWFDNDNRGSLRVIRADGTGSRVVIDGVADAAVYQWSRDGSLILAVIVGTDGSKSIALVAAADGAVRRVGTLDADLPDMMSLSPDARYVVYDYPEAPRSRDRDIFILDAHTGNQWALVASPGDDVLPLWSPKGDEILFFSDRSRALSAWSLPMANGRATGEARMVKSDVGRIWPRGFTSAGALHHQLAADFAEVYISGLDASPTSKPTPISPRQALSNFYPTWSTDGHFIAYTSERRGRGVRELWVYDAVSGREEPVPSEQTFGRPLGWSADNREILAAGYNDGKVFVVDRASGQPRLIADGTRGRAFWLPEGIVAIVKKAVVLYNPATGAVRRSYDFGDPAFGRFALGLDGRSALALSKDGRLTLREIANGAVHRWEDAGAAQVGEHAMSPGLTLVAYTTGPMGTAGPRLSLRVWAPDFEEPKELLRVQPSERVVVAGWSPDGRDVLALRWTPPDPLRGNGGVRTLWRVPIDGGAPVSTTLTMEGIRDLSIHPDGRRIAFNAGWKKYEHWVLENVLGSHVR